MKKFHLSSIALIVGSIALSGCAAKALSPELDEARKTYQSAISDPIVASLAGPELELAEKQLQVAEEAAEFFKAEEVIAHEATLALLKSKQAQQVARALAAKENLQLAQTGGLPAATPGIETPDAQSPILAAATPGIETPDAQSPILAAATPAYTTGIQNTRPVQGGHIAAESVTETQLIAQQLSALSDQINQLQTRITSGALQTGTGATHVSQYTETRVEPTLGAALPPLNSTEPEPEPEPVEILTGARLLEELRAMNARPSSRGMSLILGERYFESGSARLWTGRAGRHLDNIAAVMVENPGLLLEIEAHTDSTGSAEQKDNLTSDRAVAIKSALVVRGVNAARISATGYGDSTPLADNDTELGKLQNRRVEIIFPNVAQ